MEHSSTVRLHPESFLLEALLSPLFLFDLKCTFQALTRPRLTSFTIGKERCGSDCMITYPLAFRMLLHLDFWLSTWLHIVISKKELLHWPLAIYSSSLRVHLALRQQLDIHFPKDVTRALQDLGK